MSASIRRADAQRSTRGQVTAEFLVTLAVMLIIFLLMADIARDKYAQATLTSTNTRAQDVTNSFAYTINNVALGGDGTRGMAELPQGLFFPGDYKIDIYKTHHFVQITYTSAGKTRYYSYPILTSNINGSLTNINRTVYVVNSRGTVQIG